MRINDVSAATAAYHGTKATAQQHAAAVQRLASGLRIIRAADDPAGYVVSEKLRTQVNGSITALRNAQDGIGVVQIADAAIKNLSVLLQRGRTLALQASNMGSQDADMVAAHAGEWQLLAQEYDRVVASSSYGGTALLDGSYSATFTIGYGATSEDLLTVTIDSVARDDIGVDDASTDLASSAVSAVAAFDSALKALSNQRSTLGAAQNRMEYAIGALGSSIVNLTDAKSRIEDADMAAEVAAARKSRVMNVVANEALVSTLGVSGQVVRRIVSGR